MPDVFRSPNQVSKHGREMVEALEVVRYSSTNRSTNHWWHYSD